MRNFALLVLLCATFCCAQNGNQYSINVHVSSSIWAMEPGTDRSQAVQRLSVMIDGKKLQLAAPAVWMNFQAGVTLLTPGDYKAKLVQDIHKSAYESSQAYELLFSDKKTKKFVVVGRSE